MKDTSCKNFEVRKCVTWCVMFAMNARQLHTEIIDLDLFVSCSMRSSTNTCIDEDYAIRTHTRRLQRITEYKSCAAYRTDMHHLCEMRWASLIIVETEIMNGYHSVLANYIYYYIVSSNDKVIEIFPSDVSHTHTHKRGGPAERSTFIFFSIPYQQTCMQ